jgi:hypothetical protein
LAAVCFAAPLCGTAVGWWVSVLPREDLKWNSDDLNKIIISNDQASTLPVGGPEKRLKGIIHCWVVLILLYVQSYFKIRDPLLPAHPVIQYIIALDYNCIKLVFYHWAIL